jgi:hypothetical protein
MVALFASSIHNGPGGYIQIFACDGSGSIGSQKKHGFGYVLGGHHAAEWGIAGKMAARFLQADAFDSGLFADDALDTLALYCAG